MSKASAQRQRKSEVTTVQTIITAPTPGFNESLMLMGGQIMGGAMGYSKPDEIGSGKLLYVQAKVYDRGVNIPADPDPPTLSQYSSSDKVNWSTPSLSCDSGGDKTLAVWGTFDNGVKDLDTCDFSAFSMDMPPVAAAATKTRAGASRWPGSIPKKLYAYVGRDDAPRHQPLGRFLDSGLVRRDVIVLKFNRKLSQDDDGIKIWEAKPKAAKPAYWQLRIRKHPTHFTAELLLKDLPDSTLPPDLAWAHLWTFASPNRLRRQHIITEPIYITVGKKEP